MIEQAELDKNNVHEQYRLFLSSNPHPKFPITILQKCIKVTTEPSKGVKSNMDKLYSNMPENKFKELKMTN